MALDQVSFMCYYGLAKIAFCFKFFVNVQNFSGTKNGVNQGKFRIEAALRRSFEKRCHENREKFPRANQ